MRENSLEGEVVQHSLGNMLPVSPITNISNCWPTDAKYLPDPGTRQARCNQPSYFWNLISSECRATIALAGAVLTKCVDAFFWEGNTLPDRTLSDCLYRTVANAELLRQSAKRGTFRQESADSKDIARCQFVPVPVLGYAVLFINFVVTKKQVSWVATCRIVARMTNQLASGINAIVQIIGHAMCWQMNDSPNGEVAIGMIGRAFYWPASIRFSDCNLSPKPSYMFGRQWRDQLKGLHMLPVYSKWGQM